MAEEKKTKAPIKRAVLKGMRTLTREEWAESWEEFRRTETAKEDLELQRLSNHPDHIFLQDHKCFDDRVDHNNFEESYIGEHGDWEFSLKRCKACGRKYLRAFMESDGRSRSGRWFLGRVPMDTLVKDIEPASALQQIARHDKVFYGGSYWDHFGKWAQAPKGARVAKMFFELYHL